MSWKNGGGNPYHTERPELFVTISNDDVYEQEDIDELLPSDCAGGDGTREAKPSASSGSRPAEMSPAVAQLFSAFSTTRRSVRDDVAELLDVHEQGIKLNNFCHVFETCFRRPFDSRWSDVSSLRQMLESMVDLVECIEHGNDIIVRRKYGSGYFQGNALQL